MKNSKSVVTIEDVTGFIAETGVRAALLAHDRADLMDVLGAVDEACTKLKLGPYRILRAHRDAQIRNGRLFGLLPGDFVPGTKL